MKSLILLCDKALRKFTPDPFVIAIILSCATIGFAAVFSTGAESVESTAGRITYVVSHWGGGFWNLAEFTLQMSMILLGGFVVATSPPVKGLLLRLIGFIQTPVQAVLFCTLSALVASWINWGFGLVVGGVVAIEVGKRIRKVPFRLLVASSYSGFLVWHGGLSGSIPLTVNSEGRLSSDLLGGIIPTSQTLFGSLNLFALASLFLILPLLNLFQLKIIGDEESPDELAEPLPVDLKREQHSWLERSIVPTVLLVGVGMFYLWILINQKRFSLNLNSVNFIFFMLGMMLHGTPLAFINSVKEAVPKIAPILIQYPLYAAIMAVLDKTGLAEQMAEFFVKVANKDTFPLMTFYSAGLINLFVPSGGGQWAVQAPIVLPAARELGADIPKTIMAVAWGDAWTNMAQPFWAVPLLTIAGLQIKDIIGLCLMTLIVSGVVLSLIFWLL